MKRLIYAEDAMHRIEMETRFYSGTYAEIERAIDSAPTIDPETMRPTAHWIKRGYVCGENEYECSACHETEWRTSASRMKYCMFCGARMVSTNE